MTNNTKMLRLIESVHHVEVYMDDGRMVKFFPKDLEPAPPKSFKSGKKWHPACQQRLGCGYSERFEECIGCPYRENGPVD